MQRAILSDPVYDNSNQYFLSIEEAYENSLKKETHFLKTKKDLGVHNQPTIVQQLCGRLVTPLHLTGLHRSMFTTIIEVQSTPEQLEKWMPLIKKYRIVGTYAQTEMGHGTNVRGLETTATYSPETETFIIHSPTLTATKWWPGSLAHTSTHAIVMARLITQGQDHGIHAFIVQIRSLEDHKVLPGIKLGHIGPKMAYDIIDNGFMNFNKVHIPRENMLMKYSQVSRDGYYTRLKRDSSKLTYISMVMTRVYIVFATAESLSKACTIAIRYSAVRRQSKLDESKPELQVLDYKTQQYVLLPLLATSYAFWFTSIETAKLYFQVQMEIQEGNLSNAQELHATSAGMKAFTTQVAAAGVEACRFRCGGHGFSMSSGLPSIYGDHAAPACTYEGDNIVMMLQTARYLVKCCSMIASGQPLSTPTAAYLTSAVLDTACIATSSQDFRNPDILLRAYKHRAARLVLAVSRKVKSSTSNGISAGDAWNNCSVELVRAAQAHCHQFVVEQFSNAMKNENFSATLRPVMEALFSLYCVHGIVENARDFLEDGYMTGTHVSMANDVMMELFNEISQSPKNVRELREVAKSLDVQLLKIGKVLSTRWIASGHRMVLAVWNNYEALCKQFKNKAAEKGKNLTMYEGLNKRIQSEEFLLDLALMCDVLFELSELSEAMQHRSMNIIKANRCIKRSTRSIETLKRKTGTKLMIAKDAVKEGRFGTVPLVSNRDMSILVLMHQ
ncbi:peroxisomal acyl-coenzyme A oxidase 1-like isoform X2 [Dendronephthya gigantea]|uniref:peroxisomal acyl-coenzyme A oxidase 1-like isoform X2 n=1 Tax=Dendronephthya gigantea TaxID=151771 RepID=UPI00106CA1A1|nr:peroxisomal acyl-coenzyme A oxidase 1-like isoform X2 [Dendronephthya gigantea]